jgi:hypothetical protein
VLDAPSNDSVWLYSPCNDDGATAEPMSPYGVHTTRGWDGRGNNAKR